MKVTEVKMIEEIKVWSLDRELRKEEEEGMFVV